VIALLRASHIQPTLAVTAITTALALSAGRGPSAGNVALAVFCGQLTVGLSNDYVDRERDAVAGRLDKPIVSGRVSAQLVLICAWIAVGLCIPLSMLSGWRAGLVHLAAVAVALIYNVWLKSTVASVLAYTVAFGALPIFVALGLEGHPMARWWTIVAAGLLGSGAHFINSLSDVGHDALTNMRGLPQRLGSRASLFVGVALMAIAAVIVAVAPLGKPSLLAVLLAISSLVSVATVVVAALSGRPKAAWTACLCSAAFAVISFVASGSSLT